MQTRTIRGTGLVAAAALVCVPLAAKAGRFNKPPVVVSVSVAGPVNANGSATIACRATDDSAVFGMSATVSGGTLPDGAQFQLTPGPDVSATLRWATPAPGTYLVTCMAQDGYFSASQQTAVVVDAPAAPPPALSDVVGPATMLAGAQATFAITAVDPEGAPLAYAWAADAGTISGSGPAAVWTAPMAGGSFAVSVTVSNPGGGRATATATVAVALADHDGTLASELRMPRRLAAGPGGELYVVGGQGGVSFLTPRGGLLGSARLGEAALAAAVTPAGVAVSTASGRILLLDRRDARVLATVTAGPAPGPAGLAYEPSRGLLWMADRERNELRAITLDGATSVRVTAASGAPLQAPVDLAVDPASGLVWAAVEQSESGLLAHAFSPTGQHVRSAVTPEQVGRVGGLAADAAGRLYVSDIFTGAVQVFSPLGERLGTVGTYGTRPGELRQPAGIAPLREREVVVASMETGRLERFGQGLPLPTCAGDADCDGLPDAWELAHGLNPNFAGDAWLDSDGDGLSNLQEHALGTNPRLRDTDGDGISDGEEVAAGSDPRGAELPVLSASVTPSTPPGLVRVSSSLSASGGGCSVAWRQISGPPVTVRGAASLAPSFVARKAGRYELEGVARCGAQVLAPAVVATTVENVPPRPEPGRLAVVRPGEEFVLDGADTSDANGDLTWLSWEQVLGPAVAAPVAGPTLAAAALEPGYHEFELAATDQAGARAAAAVPVYVLPPGQAPTAIASSPLFAEVGERVVLAATDSLTGPGGRFEWRQIGGAAVALADPDGPVASFQPPHAGSYVFEVSVVDGIRSPPARVDVFVAEPGAPLPVARVAGIGAASVGEPLQLDGAGSTAGRGEALRHAWRQLAGPAAGLTDAGRPLATVVPFAAGTYVFELVVSEGAAQSVPARVRFTAAAAGAAGPVAVAYAPGTGLAGRRVLLDGARSRRAKAYRWTQVAGPWVALDGATGARAEFRPGVPGLYSFELEVDDGAGVRSAPAEVSVFVFAEEVR